MAMKLYVGGLAYTITKKELEHIFAKYGKVANATVIRDLESGQSKGLGIVEMEAISEGQIAVKVLNGKEISGRKITVKQASPQEEHYSEGNFS